MTNSSQILNGVTVNELEAVYIKDYGNFVAFARRLSGSTEEAEDLVQGIYLKLIERNPLLIKGKLIPYITKSIRNSFINTRMRSVYERKSVLLSHLSTNILEQMVSLKVDPDLNWINEEDIARRHEIIMEALKEMTACEKEAFQYRVIQGLTARETSGITGRTEASIRMSNYKAYNSLRRTLARHGIEWNSKVPYILGKNSVRKNAA